MTPEDLRKLAEEATQLRERRGEIINRLRQLDDEFTGQALSEQARSEWTDLMVEMSLDFAHAGLAALAPQLVLLCAEMAEALERHFVDGVVTDKGLFVRPEASLVALRAVLASLEALEKP